MRAVLLLALAALPAGCATYGATNSPVTKDNRAELPELVGRWKVARKGLDTFGGDSLCIAVPTPDYRTYHVTLDGCRPGEQSTVLADLAKLNGEVIAAVQQELADMSVEDSEDVLLLYSFYRIRVVNDTLLLARIEPDSLRTYLVTHPAELPFVLLEEHGPDVLLTGTSHQLADFLAAHVRDSTLWVEDRVARVH